MARVTIGDVDDEELGGNLCDTCSLLQESRHHLVWLRLSHDKLLSVVGVAEHIGVNKSLALVTDHVAVNFDVVSFHRNDHSDEFGNLKSHRVLKTVLLLHLGRFLHLFCCQNGVLVDFGKDLTDAFEPKGTGNHVDLVQAGVFKFDIAIHFADLGWVVDGFDVDSDALRVVWILREVAV